MTNTIAYRRWKVVFFAVFLILFVIPCVKFELEGIMTGTARLCLGAMIVLLAYGLIRSLIRLHGGWKLPKKESLRAGVLRAE